MGGRLGSGLVRRVVGFATAIVWAIVSVAGCASASSSLPAAAAETEPRAATNGAPTAPASSGEPTAAASAPGAHAEASQHSRFFLAGDGEIAIVNAHTGEKLRVRYRDRDGRYRPEALLEIDRLFRSRGDDARTQVSLRLIETIDYLEDRERPRAILLVSGYRSGEYNAALIARGGKAARTSMHTEGLASDLRFQGIDHRELWLRVRELDCCGAGYYANSDFLHLDVGRPRFWEAGTSRVGENLSRGNARVIARTDFDRYVTLDAAIVSLHAVTLRPLRIARAARFVPDGAGDAPAATPMTLRLDARSGDGKASDAECMTFEDAADARIRLHVAEVAGAPAAGAAPLRGRIVLRTCEPRLEATPEEIPTNPIEIRSSTS